MPPDLVCGASVNWQHIFKSPEFYLENLRDDTEIELYFKYSMPLDLRASKTAEVTFDVDEEHKPSLHKRSKYKSLSNIHRCVDNTETLQQAKSLSRELDEDIECRIKRYSK
jgi:hypothetical protein